MITREHNPRRVLGAAAMRPSSGMRRMLGLAVVMLAALAPPASAGAFPETIALPDGWGPEGIASGRGSDFYVGSIPNGAVWKGDYRTGDGEVLVPPHPGRTHVGLKYDRRGDRLFVAGGPPDDPSDGIYVYDAETGADVRSYPVPEAGFINDVVITRDGAYFTDSQVQQLYQVPFLRRGGLGELQRIPITGDFVYAAGFNANGIDATRDGRTLVIAKSNDGRLFTADSRTGVTREISLDEPVTNADGIVLDGRTLWVVRNFDNRVVEVELNTRLTRGRVDEVLTDLRLDIPTTIAPFGRALYAVNARFGRPDVSRDDIVRLEPRSAHDDDDHDHRGHGHHD